MCWLVFLHTCEPCVGISWRITELSSESSMIEVRERDLSKFICQKIVSTQREQLEQMNVCSRNRVVPGLSTTCVRFHKSVGAPSFNRWCTGQLENLFLSGHSAFEESCSMGSRAGPRFLFHSSRFRWQSCWAVGCHPPMPMPRYHLLCYSSIVSKKKTCYAILGSIYTIYASMHQSSTLFA